MGRNKNRPYTPAPTKTPVDGHYNVWCPFCDWRLGDSAIARKRLGIHIANDHPEEILFKIGTEPKDLEPERVSK